MTYSTILFDADNTLFDFDKAEQNAFFKTCRAAGLNPSEADFQTYRRINSGYWKQYETGSITKAALQLGRFQDFFAALAIDGIDPGEFNRNYLDHMAQGHFLIAGAEDVCRTLAKTHRLAIITNGLSRSQRGRLSGSAICDSISDLFISEELGVSKPDVRYFDQVLSALDVRDKSMVLIVGDSLTADIQGGINAGLDTCWYNPHGLENTLGLVPTFEIGSLQELLTLLNGTPRIWSDSTETTECLGEGLSRSLQVGDVVWLLGDLGAGKTAFVRGLARGLGCDTPVTSPTYTLVQEYKGRLPLLHFDVYRLEGFEDLLDIGWEDYLERGGVCAVEWAQKLEPLPPGRRVTFETEEHGRWITIDER